MDKMALRVERILALPIDAFTELLLESQQTGFRAIDRLITDWITESNRFDRPGEALCIARHGEQIVGVCGLNRDPYADGLRIGRVRRFYVLQSYRRQGIGRQLVQQIIQIATPNFDRLHVRTTNPVADQFYQSIGFTVCNGEFVTHALDLVACDR